MDQTDPRYQALVDAVAASESLWRKEPTAAHLDARAEARWVVVNYEEVSRDVPRALASCEALAQTLLPIAGAESGELAIVACRWLIAVAEFVGWHDEPQQATDHCKAAIAALERHRDRDIDFSITVLLCKALLILAENYAEAASRPAALEAVRYAIECWRAEFPSSYTINPIDGEHPARKELAALFRHYYYRYSNQGRVKSNQGLVDAAELIEAEGLPAPLNELTVGAATMSQVVGDAPDDRSALQRIVGRYELLEQLGQGAFGVVYKARDKLLDRIVTLKIPRVRDLDTQGRTILLEEAKAYARCSHPHIVSVFDLGSEEGVIYLVLEYIDGSDLYHLWQEHRPGLRTTIATIVGIADALAHAHGKGILHRDVKSQNILVTREGRAYLSDFGLAVDAMSQTTGQLVGTPLFMSPEQAQGETVDARSDIYSFGVVLYQLATGTFPFTGENPKKILERVSNEDPPLPSSFNRAVPKDLEAIILKCLAKNAEHRYQTATALGDDLRRFLNDELVLARRYSFLDRVLHSLSRHRQLAALSAFALVILAVSAWNNLSFAVPLTVALLIVLAWIFRDALQFKQLADAIPIPQWRRRKATAGRMSSEIVFSSQAVVTHYPAPIALAYRRFCGRDNHRERLDALFFALEGMLRYLAYLALADLSSAYVRLRPKDRVFPARPEFECLRKPVKMQLGMWVSLLRALVTELRHQKSTFFPELLEVCRPGGYFDEKILGALVHQRNRRLIHREGYQAISDAEAHDLAREARTLLEDGLKQIDFVRLYPLGFATAAARPEVQGKQRRFRIHSCMGAFIDTSNDGYVDEFRQELKTSVPFVVHQEQQRLLYLWPWLLEFVSEKSGRESLYAFECIANNKSPFLGEIRSASIEIEDPRILTLTDQSAADHQWFFRHLKELPVELQLEKESRLYERLLPSRAAQLVGHKIAQYTIVRPLSKGNFATIYLATNDKGVHCALKVIMVRDARPLIDRFSQEFEKLKAAGSHASILKCFETDVATIDGQEFPWYSMEFAVGGDLFSRMLERKASRPVPWADADTRRQVIKEYETICDAVAHLHALEIVHRDIKPSNVLVMEDGSLKLSDFGLVKNLQPSNQSLMHRHVTSTGAVLGTPYYMSPEQERGEKVGKQADVYALGILLAEMTSGELPKPGARVEQGSCLQNTPCVNKIPEGLRQLVFSNTDVDPTRRPADAAEALKLFRSEMAKSVGA